DRGRGARISKRQYVSAMQCHKRLWLEAFKPDLAAAPTRDELHRREQGIEVGRAAHRLFPDGLYLDDELDFERHLARSREALSQRRTLFEPAFATGDAYARADVLVPVEGGGWNLIEVKSTTKVHKG